MTRKALLGTFVALTGAGFVLSGGRVLAAEEVLAADLDTRPEGGIHAMVPQKVKLSAKKPAGRIHR